MGVQMKGSIQNCRRMAGLQKKHLHVVAVAMPTPGHLNPLMRFCKLLAKQAGVTVTVIDFDDPSPSLSIPVASETPITTTAKGAVGISETATATVPVANPPPHPLVHRAHIPIPGGLDLSKGFIISLHQMYKSLDSIAPDLEQLILSLNRSGPPVTCLLADFNITIPAQIVADKLGIPRIMLHPCSASRLLLTHYVSQGELISMEAVKEAVATTNVGQRRKVFRQLPGLPTLYNNDIPHFKHLMDETNAVWMHKIKAWQLSTTRAHAVVVNSFQDLEAVTFSTLSRCCDVPIYDMGLWVEPLLKESATSLWREDSACMSWLGQQPTSSVLYISFGSITLLSRSQYEEFLHGLLSSQQRFLWVLRPGLVQENIDYSSSAASIMSKSHGKGLVINWAPQLQVLGHSSVGGFLTHCGWNSTSESIASGVPMLCWPYFSDQPLNAHCIVNEWKVGLQLECSKEETSIIESNEIEKVIRALMEGPEGRIVRDNATKLKQKSDKCFLENGSSYMNLKTLIESLQHCSSQPPF